MSGLIKSIIKWGIEMKKKVLSFIIAAMTAASMLAGCAAPGAVPAAGEPAAQPEAEQAAPVQEEAAEHAEAAIPEEVVDINVALLDIGDNSEEGKAAVIDAMNAITEKAIGVRINPTWGTFGTYGNMVSLALTANEPLDLVGVFMPPVDFPTMYSNNQVLDATEYLEEYAPELIQEIGRLYDNYNVDGKVYGVPTHRNIASSIYIVIRQDVLEDNGLFEDFKAAETWSEVEDIMIKLKEATGIAAIGDVAFPSVIFGEDRFDDAVTFANFADTQRLIYSDDEGNVSCLLDQEAYIAERNMIRRFYDEGIIYPELPYFRDLDGTTLMKTDQALCWIAQTEIGMDTGLTGVVGHPIYQKKLKGMPISSQSSGFVFPMTCSEPEAAAKWLNEFYTNPELENLFVYGIEGKDYEVADGIARYPEGVDGTNVQYHQADFMYGNSFNCLPWDGSPANFRDLCREEVANAEYSPYFGFTANTGDLGNLIAGITNCYEEYGRRVAYGAFTDEDLEKYRANLDAAGIGEYLDAYQEQLKAWLAAK